jgi:hypothetical protein
MADESKGQEKSIEMRVAELEDKLAQVHITEDELKAFHKVSALMAGPANQGAAAAACGGCVSECGVIRQPIAILQCIQCVIRQPIIRQPIIRQPIIQQCVECFECQPGAPGGQFGGQFGAFGG